MKSSWNWIEQNGLKKMWLKPWTDIGCVWCDYKHAIATEIILFYQVSISAPPHASITFPFLLFFQQSIIKTLMKLFDPKYLKLLIWCEIGIRICVLAVKRLAIILFNV